MSNSKRRKQLVVKQLVGEPQVPEMEYCAVGINGDALDGQVALNEKFNEGWRPRDYGTLYHQNCIVLLEREKRG